MSTKNEADAELLRLCDDAEEGIRDTGWMPIIVAARDSVALREDLAAAQQHATFMSDQRDLALNGRNREHAAACDARLTVGRMALHLATLHQLLGIRPSIGPRAAVEQHAERVLKDVLVASRENSAATAVLEIEVARLREALVDARRTVCSYIDYVRFPEEDRAEMLGPIDAALAATESKS